jgi:hypothetical protein
MLLDTLQTVVAHFDSAIDGDQDVVARQREVQQLVLVQIRHGLGDLYGNIDQHCKCNGLRVQNRVWLRFRAQQRVQ